MDISIYKIRRIKDYYTNPNNGVYVIGNNSIAPPSNITQDGSVAALYHWNYSQDASIVRIDSSVSSIWVKNINQDTSINFLTQWHFITNPSLGRVDASTKFLTQWQPILNSSLGRVDVSTRDLTQWKFILNSSLGRVDASVRNILSGTTTFKGAKTYDTQIISDNGIKSSNFNETELGITGFNLDGSTLSISKGNFDFFTAKDFEAIKMRATNGPLIISEANGKVKEGLFYDSNRKHFVFNTERAEQFFKINDLIKAQLSSAGANNYLYEWSVYDAKDASVWINQYLYDTSITTNNIVISNVNINSFSDTGPYYAATATATGQYCQTDLFNAKQGTLYVSEQLSRQGAPGGDSLTVRLVDSGGSTYSTIGSTTVTATLSSTVTIPSDVSLRIRTIMNSTGIQWGITKPSRINTWQEPSTSYPNVEGVEFVQVGNSSTGAGFISLTPNKVGITFYDNVKSFTPTAANQPFYVRYNDSSVLETLFRGRLDALESSIGGWNTDEDAIYIESKSTSDGFASAGFTIGNGIHTPNFYINKNGTFGTRTATSGERIEINSSTNNITLYNSNNNWVVKIDNDFSELSFTLPGIVTNDGQAQPLVTSLLADGFRLVYNGVTKAEIRYDKANSKLIMILKDLPTSSSGLASGQVWKNGTALNITN
jgi:hypothetical protein